MAKTEISPDELADWCGFLRIAGIISGRIVQDITRATCLSCADFVVLMELDKAKDG